MLACPGHDDARPRGAALTPSVPALAGPQNVSCTAHVVPACAAYLVSWRAHQVWLWRIGVGEILRCAQNNGQGRMHRPKAAQLKLAATDANTFGRPMIRVEGFSR